MNPSHPEWTGHPGGSAPSGGALPGPQHQSPTPIYGLPKPPVDGFAITSLITGLLGGVLFSVGFGIAALRRIRRKARRGRGLAIAGLVLSLAWVVVVVGVIAYQVGRKPDRNRDGTITRQGQVAPADLRVGDCVRVPRALGGTYTSLTVTPCRQPHNGQVFATPQATDPTYPGDEALQAMALSECRRLAPAFLGTDQTPLHIVAFFPPEQAWNIGRRDEHCLLVDRAKDITGDIRSDN